MECRIAKTFDWEWGPSTLQRLGKAQALRIFIYIYTYILYFIILYCITAYYIILYYTIIYYLILYYIVLYYIILYYILSYIILYVILYYIISYYIILYYIILYYIISYYIISCYIILYHIILYYIMLLYIYIVCIDIHMSLAHWTAVFLVLAAPAVLRALVPLSELGFLVSMSPSNLRFSHEMAQNVKNWNKNWSTNCQQIGNFVNFGRHMPLLANISTTSLCFPSLSLQC